MKNTLALKILLPYLILGLVILIAFSAIHRINAQAQQASAVEARLLASQSLIHELSSSIQSSILTRNDAHAIRAANLSLELDGILNTLSGQEAGAAELLNSFQDYFASMVAVSSMFLENRTQEGEQQLQRVSQLQGRIDAAVSQHIEHAESRREQAAGQATRFMVGAVLALLAIMAVVGVLVTRQVVQPIRQVARSMKEIAHGEGDLTRRLPVSSRDEVGEIATAFNQMQDSLRSMISGTADCAGQLADAVAQMAAAVTQVEMSSRAQGESASAMAAAVEELTVSVSHVSSMANDTESASRAAAEASQHGVQLAEHSSADMKALTSTGERASALAEQLTAESRKISGLVGTIHDIAEQTNLLALNAAIEAARAGETGRGFAVVADEVRKLAERTNSEASSIRSIVEGMAGVVAQISDTIRLNTEEELKESASAHEVSEIFASVGAQSSEAAQQVRDIAHAMQEQSAAATDIARNVENVARMAEQNSSAVRSVSHGATELQHLANALRERVGRFRF